MPAVRCCLVHGYGEWSLICTGHNPVIKAVPLWGHAELKLCGEVVEHGAIPKASWGPAGATGQLVVMRKLL